MARGATQGGAEEESIGFQVCSSGCSIDTAVLGLLGHLSITASAKPVLQTHIRACQIFKVKVGGRISGVPCFLQSIFWEVRLLLTLCSSCRYYNLKRWDLQTFLVAVPN